MPWLVSLISQGSLAIKVALSILVLLIALLSLPAGTDGRRRPGTTPGEA